MSQWKRPILSLLAAAALLAPAVAKAGTARRASVQVYRWEGKPRGVTRRDLASSRVRIESGAGRIRLAGGNEHGTTERFELRFRNLDGNRPQAQLVDLTGATAPSPVLAFLPGTSVLRVAPSPSGLVLQALHRPQDDILDMPPPGSWEVELGPIPPRVQSLWGQHLAVATVDGDFSFLPPVQ